ncbi:MAG: dephospho-CoA kinase [Planctomycetota bacterium]
MGRQKNKPLIGIVGGICSGKSIVAAEFAKLGCAIIDADRIVRDLYLTDAVRQQLLSIFGRDVLDQAGQIDHRKLSKRIFKNSKNVQKINSIVHPLVLSRAEALIETYNIQDNIVAIVLDIPLLLEVGWQNRCDKIVFVSCDEEKRLERSGKKGQITPESLKIRENFQISLDKKTKIAHYIVDNNSDLSTLAGQVSNVFSRIMSGG